MTNLEDQIIAYLDGTLDENSRAELLHMLSVSPEKRKLLEEHIKLREIISLGHKPQPVPIRTEKQLADRIPVLLQELPYLAEKSTRFVPVAGIRSTSYLSAVSRYVSGFFTTRFAPAIGLGMLALVGGLTWYVASSPDDTEVAHLVASRQSSERVKDNSSGSITDRQGTANVAAPSAEGSSVEQSSLTSATRNTQSGIQLNRSSRTTNIQSQSGDIRTVENHGISNTQSDIDLNARDRQSRESREMAINNPADDNASNASNTTSSNEASKREERDVTTPLTDIPSSNASSSDIKNPAIDPTPLPLPSEDKSITGRWYAQATMASDMNFRPNTQEQVYQAGAGKTFPVIGGGYELTPNFAIGLELGMSELSQQNEEIVLPSTTGGASSNVKLNEVRRVEYNTTIVDVDAVWTQATLRYTLNPEDRYRIEATGGAGAAYVDGLAPMVSLGVGGTYSLFGNVDLTMGASVRGAWLSEQGTSTTANEPLDALEAPVAVVSNRAPSSTIFTSAVSGRIGLRIGL